MKIKFNVLFVLSLLSFNINADISQSGISNLQQLGNQDMVELISGNKLTGFISDGPFEGPITQSFYKDGKYETIFNNKIYTGTWKVEGKKHCTKGKNKTDFGCFYWYTGVKDGGTYAYVVAQGKLLHQYHAVESATQVVESATQSVNYKYCWSNGICF
tara:strand:- start:223 stop:696 length:474 start_codon:yes stop_codon:yes gene_type:complete